MAQNKVVVEFVADLKNFNTALRDARRRSEDFADGIGASAQEAAVGLGSLAAAGGLALKAMLGAASEVQNYEATLRALTGSQSAATRELAKFQQVALESSFELKDIVDAGVKLRAFGQDVDDLLPLARDLAAVMNKDLGSAVDGIGKVASGSANGLEILSDSFAVSRTTLLEFGAVAGESAGSVSLVGDNARKAVDALKKLAEARGITGADVERVKTLAGQFSQLSDATSKLAAAFGQELAPAVFPVVQGIVKLIEGFTSLSPAMKQTIVFATAGVAALAGLGAGAAAIAAGVAALAPGIAVLGATTVSITSLAGAMVALRVATIAAIGPFGLLLAGATVLAGGIVLVSEAASKSRRELETLTSEIEGRAAAVFRKTASEAAELKIALDELRFGKPIGIEGASDKLAGALKDSSAATLRLHKVSDELRAAQERLKLAEESRVDAARAGRDDLVAGALEVEAKERANVSALEKSVAVLSSYKDAVRGVIDVTRPLAVLEERANAERARGYEKALADLEKFRAVQAAGEFADPRAELKALSDINARIEGAGKLEEANAQKAIAATEAKKQKELAAIDEREARKKKADAFDEKAQKELAAQRAKAERDAAAEIATIRDKSISTNEAEQKALADQRRLRVQAFKQFVQDKADSILHEVAIEEAAGRDVTEARVKALERILNIERLEPEQKKSFEIQKTAAVREQEDRQVELARAAIEKRLEAQARLNEIIRSGHERELSDLEIRLGKGEEVIDQIEAEIVAIRNAEITKAKIQAEASKSAEKKGAKEEVERNPERRAEIQKDLATKLAIIEAELQDQIAGIQEAAEKRRIRSQEEAAKNRLEAEKRSLEIQGRELEAAQTELFNKLAARRRTLEAQAAEGRDVSSGLTAIRLEEINAEQRFAADKLGIENRSLDVQRQLEDVGAGTARQAQNAASAAADARLKTAEGVRTQADLRDEWKKTVGVIQGAGVEIDANTGKIRAQTSAVNDQTGAWKDNAQARKDAESATAGPGFRAVGGATKGEGGDFRSEAGGALEGGPELGAAGGEAARDERARKEADRQRARDREKAIRLEREALAGPDSQKSVADIDVERLEAGIERDERQARAGVEAFKKSRAEVEASRRDPEAVRREREAIEKAEKKAAEEEKELAEKLARERDSERARKRSERLGVDHKRPVQLSDGSFATPGEGEGDIRRTVGPGGEVTLSNRPQAEPATVPIAPAVAPAIAPAIPIPQTSIQPLIQDVAATLQKLDASMNGLGTSIAAAIAAKLAPLFSQRTVNPRAGSDSDMIGLSPPAREGSD